ncbi:hypothetical protein [Galactobacter valiniphilus]|uniref:hypothetical protein n=1 Tax=Galactobacter valiniphilus TaxID=2676122 RepID=UPI003735D84A
MLKKILRGAGALALSGGLIASGAALAAPAQAVVAAPAATPVYIAKPITVTAVKTDGDYYKGGVIRVSSKGCKSNYISIKATNTVAGTYPSFKLTADIYRGKKKIKTINFRENSTGSLVNFCPKSKSARYGAFQIKNVRVSGWYYVKDTNGNYVFDANDNAVKKSFSYGVSAKSKTFHYKGAVDGSLYGKKQAGSSKRTFTAKLSIFSDKYQKWVKYNPSGAKLQVKSGGKWKSIKSLKFKKGKAVYSLRASSKKTYRLYVPAKSYALGGATSGFKL